MEISIFEVLGPVMIGPSSSHTAGAARLGRAAAQIAAKPFGKVLFGLGGSLAKTGRGHGTDKALLAGVLGLSPADEGIKDAYALAAARRLAYAFFEEDLGSMHENSAHLTFLHQEGGKTEVWGSSVGGGRILITRIDGFDTTYHAESPALLVDHLDRPGVISEVSRLLALQGINIAVLRLSRVARGGQASAMFIVDSEVPPALAEEVQRLAHVKEVRVLNVS